MQKNLKLYDSVVREDLLYLNVMEWAGKLKKMRKLTKVNFQSASKGTKINKCLKKYLYG